MRQRARMGSIRTRQTTPTRGLVVLFVIILVLCFILVPPLTAHSQSNSPPHFQSENIYRLIRENSPPGNAVGDPIVASDPDVTDRLTYSLSGLDETFFDIDGASGQLRVGESLAYGSKTRFFVVVRATDSGGLYDVAPVTIDVAAMDQPGQVVLSTSDVQVGAELTATLTDPDGSFSGLVWQWASSPNGVTWADVAAADSATFVPGAAELSQYLRARVTYNDGYGDGKAAESITGRVLPASQVNYPPEFPYFESGVRDVTEAIPVGEKVGLPMLAGDLDRDLLSYQISGEAAEFFSIDSATGQVRVKASILSRGQHRYFGAVEVFDGRGGSDFLALRIDVVDVEPPEELPEKPVTAVEETAEAEQETEAAPSPPAAGPAPQAGAAGSSGAAGSNALTVVATSEPAPAPTAVPQARSTGRSTQAIPPTPLPAKARQSSGDASDEGEEAVAAVAAAVGPLAPPAALAMAADPAPGEGPGSSGWAKPIPFLPWWLNLFLLAFFAGALGLVAWWWWLGRKEKPRRPTTLPSPFVGPVRRIAPPPMRLRSEK